MFMFLLKWSLDDMVTIENDMQALTTIFDTTQLMPHGYCLVWNSALLWLHVISDALIVLSKRDGVYNPVTHVCRLSSIQTFRSGLQTPTGISG